MTDEINDAVNGAQPVLPDPVSKIILIEDYIRREEEIAKEAKKRNVPKSAVRQEVKRQEKKGNGKAASRPAMSKEELSKVPPLGELLTLTEGFLTRFVVYPSEEARAAHTLWVAHAHLMDAWYTTPRMALMSAEKASGKTRALEVTALLVPEPILSINASPSVIVRLISQSRPTILYDEIDGVFGNAKAQEANTDLRSVLNGGYRRGAKVHRCVTANGKKVETEELDAFSAVAVAGLRELPDTLASRAIFIRMKKRAPHERVESFRYRAVQPQGDALRRQLAARCGDLVAKLTFAEPEMPAGIVDRDAECWEPLIAIADEAGGDWPARARQAAVYLTKNATDESMTYGVELLGHIREAFGKEDRVWTETLLQRLCDRDESPWKDIRGKPLNDRGLGKRLKDYGIKSKSIRIGEAHKKGYAAEEFHDAWSRYCPSPTEDARASASSERDKGDKGDNIDNENNYVPDVPDVPADVASFARVCDHCGGEADIGNSVTTWPDQPPLHVFCRDDWLKDREIDDLEIPECLDRRKPRGDN